MLPLRLDANAMHHAGAYLATALQRAGNLLQECVAAFHRQRPGGPHHGDAAISVRTASSSSM